MQSHSDTKHQISGKGLGNKEDRLLLKHKTPYRIICKLKIQGVYSELSKN